MTMTAAQQVAAGLRRMTWREMNELATALTTLPADDSISAMADTLSTWAESIEVSEAVTVRYAEGTAALPRTPIGDDELNEDGSLKKNVKTEGTPHPDIPGSVVQAQQGGPGRMDMPRARPKSDEGVIEEGGTLIDPDGTISKLG